MACIIPRVMPLLLKEEKNKNDYIPKVVSIGPYHHGEPELAPVEDYKSAHAVDIFVSGGKENTDFYYRKVLEMIGEIRECWYEKESTDAYSDDELARMMLNDACFIINYMEIVAPDSGAQPANRLTRFKEVSMKLHLGMLTLVNVQRDLFLLENQIPFDVIKLLINLRYDVAEKYYENLLNRYLKFSLFKEYRQKREMEIERAEPLYLLEAYHMLLIPNFKKTVNGRRLCCFKVEKPHTLIDGGRGIAMRASHHESTRRWRLCCPRSSCFDMESGVGPTPTMTMTSADSKQGLILCLLRTLGCKKKAAEKEKVIHSFRSATDLKAKGIHFKPSPTKFFKDTDFKSHFLYATVQLPYWDVTILTKVFFLNMIAFEWIPNSSSKWEVTSYINFMKSLMERAEDVKELRDMKILNNKLGSDEEVLSVYKDIHTYGADNPEVFGELKDKIQAHYQSRTKTWMAELIHTHFRTPWTFIAFLAAISLLAISVAQLQYAVHPN